MRASAQLSFREDTLYSLLPGGGWEAVILWRGKGLPAFPFSGIVLGLRRMLYFYTDCPAKISKRSPCLQVINRAAARSYTKVRLVGEETNEVVSVLEALSRAEEAGLDLVLISDKGDVPVVRVQDFKKVQYELKKSKKKQVVQELKEIQLKLNIADHDFQTKLNAIDKFLSRGDKVKVVVRLKGRERENPERARALLDRVLTSVKAKSSIVPGPITMAILEPIK